MARTALLPLCLLLASTAAQSPGSNPGLPPSATATGLAPQKLTDMTGEGRSTFENGAGRCAGGTRHSEAG